tara:strand:+ start:199 stop:477 length:279 start_codon:yes stop_codon:yes gene_type:complete
MKKQNIHFGSSHHIGSCPLWVDRLEKHINSRYVVDTLSNGMNIYKYKISHPLQKSCITKVNCPKCLRRIIKLAQIQIHKFNLEHQMLNEMDS